MSVRPTDGAAPAAPTAKRRGIQIKPSVGETRIPGNPSIKLPISALTLDPEIQQRATTSADLIAEYAESIHTWIDSAPITVFTDGQTRWVADGFHRVEAGKVAHLEAIPAHQHQGSRRDALLFAVTANQAHGLRRTNADKRRAVETLLSDAEWSQWSDRIIADKAGVSHPTVAAIRRELENFTSCDDPTSRAATTIGSTDEPTKRIGADGKARAVPTRDLQKAMRGMERSAAKRQIKKALKAEQDRLREIEEQHRLQLDETQRQIVEAQGNRPRTEAETIEQQATLQTLQAQSRRLEAEAVKQRQARFRVKGVLIGWAEAVRQYQDAARGLISAADRLQSLSSTQDLRGQVEALQELTAQVARTLDEARTGREVSP